MLLLGRVGGYERCDSGVSFWSSCGLVLVYPHPVTAPSQQNGRDWEYVVGGDVDGLGGSQQGLFFSRFSYRRQYASIK